GPGIVFFREAHNVVASGLEAGVDGVVTLGLRLGAMVRPVDEDGRLPVLVEEVGRRPAALYGVLPLVRQAIAMLTYKGQPSLFEGAAGDTFELAELLLGGAPEAPGLAPRARQLAKDVEHPALVVSILTVDIHVVGLVVI